jgi:formylglycine-generating enzyme required for sulfatase activity
MKFGSLVLLFLFSGLYASSQTKPVIEWIDIPAGTFIMGSPKSEFDRSDYEIQHEVTLNTFRMSKYEVTFEQYDTFCEATGRKKPDDNGWGRGKQPVINVTWFDAVAFTKWIGCRLPTEAEWEYACRAGTTTPFSTGNNLTTNQANYDGNFPYNNNPKGENRGRTLPVGSFAPNQFKLHDMHGNAWEWVNDWYENYTNAPQNNPQGPSTGMYKVYRGGGWNLIAQFCRSAKRRYIAPDRRFNYIGFRVAAYR